MSSTSIVIGLVLAAVVIAAALLRRPEPPLSPDGEVLAQLKKAGSNLSKPHPVEFFLYFPTSEAAERVGATLRADGFEIVVKPGAKGPDWLVQATRSMLPVEAELIALRQRFEALARREGGVYDGWGTPVVQ